ncbi:MAG: response regulator [Desulfobacterales bacterium]
MADKLNASVLLVDDEEQFLQVLSERLTNHGLHVNSVTSGEEAVAQVENKNFDAVVLDLAMPGINGIETMKRIKEKRPELEIIILTGHATVKVGIEAMKLGAEDFLEKPVDLNVLLERIREAKHKRKLDLEKESQNEMKQILKTKSW